MLRGMNYPKTWARNVGRHVELRLELPGTLSYAMTFQLLPDDAVALARQLLNVSWQARDPSVVAQGPRPSGAGEGQRDPDGGV